MAHIGFLREGSPPFHYIPIRKPLKSARVARGGEGPSASSAAALVTKIRLRRAAGMLNSSAAVAIADCSSGADQRGLRSKVTGLGVIQRERSNFLEEVRMRHIQFGLFPATIVLSLMASATPSAAVVIYPWCGNYFGLYTLSCGSTSLKQCLATQAGNGGSCVPNPYYQPYPPPPTYSPPITRSGSGYR